MIPFVVPPAVPRRRCISTSAPEVFILITVLSFILALVWSGISAELAAILGTGVTAGVVATLRGTRLPWSPVEAGAVIAR